MDLYLYILSYCILMIYSSYVISFIRWRLISCWLIKLRESSWLFVHTIWRLIVSKLDTCALTLKNTCVLTVSPWGSPELLRGSSVVATRPEPPSCPSPLILKPLQTCVMYGINRFAFALVPGPLKFILSYLHLLWYVFNLLASSNNQCIIQSHSF